MASQTEQQITQRLDDIFQNFESSPATQAYYQKIAGELKTTVLEELVAGADFTEAIETAFADTTEIRRVLASIAIKKPPVYTYDGDPFFQETEPPIKEEHQKEPVDTNTVTEKAGHQESQNHSSSNEKQATFSEAFEDNSNMNISNWKDFGHRLLENIQPLKDELLGLVGEVVGDPLLVRKRLENATHLENAWWVMQEKKTWTTIQYDLPGTGVKKVIFDDFTDSNLGLFVGPDEDFHIIEQLALDNGDLFSRYELGGRLRFTEGPRPAVAKSMKSFLTVYFPKNFTGQLQLTNNSGKILIGGLTNLKNCQLNLKSSSVIARELSSHNLLATATSGSLDFSYLLTTTASLTTKSGSLWVTESESDRLEASGTSGSLHLSNSTYRELIASAKSGNLKLTQLTARQLDGRTKSGTLSMKNITCPEIYGETKSGSMHLQQLQIGGLIKSKSGTIRCNQLELASSLELTTKDGNLKVQLTPEESYHFDLHTINGQVKHLGDYTSEISHRNHLVGSEGNHPVYELVATTKNGNITFE